MSWPRKILAAGPCGAGDPLTVRGVAFRAQYCVNAEACVRRGILPTRGHGIAPGLHTAARLRISSYQYQGRG